MLIALSDRKQMQNILHMSDDMIIFWYIFGQ